MSCKEMDRDHHGGEDEDDESRVNKHNVSLAAYLSA